MARARKGRRLGSAVYAKRSLAGMKSEGKGVLKGLTGKKRGIVKGLRQAKKGKIRKALRGHATAKRSARQIASAKRNLAGARRKRR